MQNLGAGSGGWTYWYPDRTLNGFREIRSLASQRISSLMRWRWKTMWRHRVVVIVFKWQFQTRVRMNKRSVRVSLKLNREHVICYSVLESKLIINWQAAMSQRHREPDCSRSISIYLSWASLFACMTLHWFARADARQLCKLTRLQLWEQALDVAHYELHPSKEARRDA